MSDVKYIIIDDFYASGPIVFGPTLTHSDVAGSRRVVSAGFVSIGAKEDGTVSVECYGESVSLKIKARSEDSLLVAKMLGVIHNYNDEPCQFF